MVQIPGADVMFLKTEVTQKLYEKVMGTNPSSFIGEKNPVESVSFYDAIYFCNKFSILCELEPVYLVDGYSDTSKWNYEPHRENEIEGVITQNMKANGYRLPSTIEWDYAAHSGEDFFYAGSDNPNEVGWFFENSNNKTHEVAQKKPNAQGLYDMNGNVWEWSWDNSWYGQCIIGGSISEYYDDNVGSSLDATDRWKRCSNVGFRIVCGRKSPTIILLMKNKMIEIPGKKFHILANEVTQELYESVIGENPSISTQYMKGINFPVSGVSWDDAIYFCNKLSEYMGLESVYHVDGEYRTRKWGYTPNNGEKISGTVFRNENANGYRLPTIDEWVYAAKGGYNFIYSGSDNLDEVGWYVGNSDGDIHTVAQKKPNGYGLYDMSGNVWEWCWDNEENEFGLWLDTHTYGGDCTCRDDYCTVTSNLRLSNGFGSDTDGFRIVCSSE